MRAFLFDLRYAARTLGRSPGLILVAVLSLGLGMGVNTTLFSAVMAVLFEETTASTPDRLVRIWIGGEPSVSYLNLQDLRGSGILADAAGYRLTEFSVRSAEEALRATGEVVTANYFDVVGVRAAIGRTFSPEEAEPRREPRVAVLSDGYWRRHFGGDPAVVGRNLGISGQQFTVIGVLPATYRSIEGFGLAPEIYVPVSRALAESYQRRDGYRLRVLGRMQNGRTRQQTQSAFAAVATQLERGYPRENKGFARAGARVFGISAMERLREARASGPVMVMTSLLAAVSGTVLLIACGNVAGLLLARGANRRREITVRLALGAGRRRIVQQLLAESLLLALLGAACGWLLNLWTIGLLGNFKSPLPLPLEWHLEQGLGLLPLELLLAVGAMLLCGLAPAMESMRVELAPALKETPSQAGSRRFTRRGLLVAGQVAGSMVLLVIASLFLRSLGQVLRVDRGFDADRILTVEITLDNIRFNKARGLEYVDEAIRRVSTLPGVEAASVAVRAPLSWKEVDADIGVESRQGVRVPQARLNCVTPGYFRTLGITLVRGRDFQTSDKAGAPRVVIVGETFAKRFFPDTDALGKRVQADGRTSEIVGIVRDSKYLTLAEAPQPLLYQPLAQDYGMGTVLHVRTAGPPSALVAAVKRELSSIEKDVPVSITPLREIVEQSLMSIRAGATMLAIMGGLGMLLALIGLYGVISYSVSRRTAEIGIRMTLGASPAAVLRGVLKDGLVLIGFGVAVGLLIALALMRPLSMYLSGVKANDPLGLLAPALLLLAAGLGATYVPARRATKVDPMAALRCE